MRASSLSDDRVIRLVSAYFVPVHVSRDNYLLSAPDADTLRELDRIDRERKAKKLEGGIVAVYILNPDGSVIASIAVQQAFYPDKFAAFLNKVVADNKLEPRLPEDVKKSAAEAPPPRRPKTPDGLLLAVRARFNDGKSNGSTSVDYLDLSADQWRRLTPAADAKEGATWEVPEAVADRLLILCYPPTPHWNTKENKISARTLTATLVSVDGDVCVVKLSGRVDMFHPFTGKPDDNRLSARVVGYVRYDRGKKAVTDFNLAAEEAVFVRYYQGRQLSQTPFRFAAGVP